MRAVIKDFLGATAGDAARRRCRHVATGFGLVALQLLYAAPVVAEKGESASASIFKIYLQKAGVYRLNFEELREAGLEAAVDAHRLALTQRGQDVPIWVEDGGDGQFGPGDRIEFIGERLSGHRSHYSEYTSINVYRLELGRPGLRMTSPAPPSAAPPAAAPEPLRVEEHVESDFFLLRFDSRREEIPEPWYWKRLTHIDPKPFQHGFWLDRYQPHPEQPMSLKVHLQGWSTAGGELPDHRADVYLNGELVGSGEWDGEEAMLIEVPEVPAKLARIGSNLLEIRIPKRRPEEGADPVIDEVVLNWIEIRYPRQARIDGHQVRFMLSEDTAESMRLATAPGSSLLAYGSDGSRYDRRNTSVEDSGATTRHVFRRPTADALYAVPDGKLKVPLTVEREQPSDLRNPTRQADYIVITHPRLRQAIEPLVEYHRQRGLEVAVVLVPEIYDQFSHSIVDPHAIRDFLSHAYHQWQRPAPRYVLLVGDASWAGRSSGSSYGLGERLPGKAKSRRNLIPAGLHEGIDGPAASDNFYVAVAGDDQLPDMAIGRFPVTEPEEVAAIVDKTLSYVKASGVGPWRRSIAWIASDISSFRRHSNKIADSIADQGFVPHKVYPRAHEKIQHQDTVREAIDQGQLLVHFHGHGGRFIWRTGIATFRGSGDLFTLDHLDQLTPAANLPVVLSMTCHSAPFDHPVEDSIGEKFLRLDGRGAVAVLAASWRVSPFPPLSQALIEELIAQPTIGEAIQRAKHRVAKSPGLVAKYNLLGDPALELALPKHSLDIEARAAGKNGWEISTAVPDDVHNGRAVVDWLDEAGEVIYSESLRVNGGALETQLRRAPILGAIAAVRVYVWNEDAGSDGMGALRLLPESG